MGIFQSVKRSQGQRYFMGTAQVGAQAAQAHIVAVAHAQASRLHASHHGEYVLSSNVTG